MIAAATQTTIRVVERLWKLWKWITDVLEHRHSASDLFKLLHEFLELFVGHRAWPIQAPIARTTIAAAIIRLSLGWFFSQVTTSAMIMLLVQLSAARKSA